MEANRSPDIARATLQLLALGVLIASSFWIVRPFLVALTWATTIVVAQIRALKKGLSVQRLATSNAARIRITRKVRVRSWLGGWVESVFGAVAIAMSLSGARRGHGE